MTAVEFLFNVKPKSESVCDDRTESAYAISVSFDLEATMVSLIFTYISPLSIVFIYDRIYNLSHRLTHLFAMFVLYVAIADDAVCDNQLISIATCRCDNQPAEEPVHSPAL